MGAAGGEELVQGPSGREEKIFVSIRLRPLNEKEIARNDVSEWECINDNTIIYRNNLSVSERSMYPTAYTFDRVYRSDCSTRQVYEEAAKEVALVVVSGINASACYGYEDQGVMIAAVSEALWENGAACGRMYSVTCTGPTNQGVPQPCRGTVTVKVVDRCPGCEANNIDLSQEAFSAIADPNAGKINIDYNQV